jgi:dienelactone hydrolase
MQRAVTFGANDALVGVLSSPANLRQGAPVVLLTNAGVLPRQGPHRINVRIAQALASEGIPSMRVDLSGHGDSLSIGNAADICAQAVLDLKSAMDWVQQSTGASRFLMFGVCSGAVNGYNLALADERIAGVLMFDGYWYRSRWTTPVRDLKRAMDVDWRGRAAAIRRRVLSHRKKDAQNAPAVALDLLSAGNPYAPPPLASFTDAMQRLVDRGTDVFIVYSGSILEYYSYAGQFKDVFGGYPFFPHVRCEFHPDIDHTFIIRQAQNRMVDLTCGWVRAHLDRATTTVIGAR